MIVGVEHNGERTWRRLTVAGVVVGLMAATAFGVVIFLGSAPPEGSFEAVGFPLLWAMPALLALLSLWERPVLLVPAAVLSFLLSFSALSGVTLVLLIPTVCYVLAYRRRRYYPPTLTRPLLAVLLPVLACAGALIALVARPDPVCWTYLEDAGGTRTYSRTGCDETDGMSPSMTVSPPTADRGSGSGSGVVAPGASGGGSTSDTVTLLEAAASATLLAAGLAAGWVASRSDGGNGSFPTRSDHQNGGDQAERRRPAPPRRPTARRASRKSTST